MLTCNTRLIMGDHGGWGWGGSVGEGEGVQDKFPFVYT